MTHYTFLLMLCLLFTLSLLLFPDNFVKSLGCLSHAFLIGLLSFTLNVFALIFIVINYTEHNYYTLNHHW